MTFEIKIFDEFKNKEKTFLITKGMGATKSVGSDCYPYTVVDIKSNGKEIHAQRDNSTPTEDSDYFGVQSYTYSPNPDSDIEIFTLRKNGYFVKKGKPLNYYWDSISLGKRRYYRDPSF